MRPMGTGVGDGDHGYDTAFGNPNPYANPCPSTGPNPSTLTLTLTLTRPRRRLLEPVGQPMAARVRGAGGGAGRAATTAHPWRLGGRPAARRRPEP
eukprot:scaffold40821_cov33-Phaeocystis_antarctica.AAC.2